MRPRIRRCFGMMLCCLPAVAFGDGTRTPAAVDDAPWTEAIGPALQAEYLAAVLTEDCQQIAQPSQFAIDPEGPTYWGNAFTILRESELTGFEFELTLFNDPTPLHFSVYRAFTPLEPDTPYGFREFCPVFIGEPIDAVPVGDPGAEQPAFYAANLPKHCGGLGSGAPCASDGDCTAPDICDVVPLTLEVGYDYVLAVAWGPEVVEVHKDLTNTTYPRPLEGEDGKTLGVTVRTGPDLPLDPGACLSSRVFANLYALSMNLCLEPQPGACCDSNDCLELKPGECLPANTFTRERLTCEDLVTVEEETCPLSRWACCIPGASCLRIDKFACETLQGTWHRDKLCTDFPDPCALKGGCCKAGGTCTVVTEAECELLDALYRGDNTTCGTFCATGACCVPDPAPGANPNCSNLSISNCSLNGGAWQGHGTRCASDGSTCDPRGACCNETTCQDAAVGMTEGVCVAGGGLYQGDWTTCDTLDVSCGRGACCTPTAGCRKNLTRSVCQSGWSGTYLGDGTTCDTAADACLGRCCDDGICVPGLIPPRECDASGTGVFVGFGQSCSADPCAPPLPEEPCCLPDLSCIMVSSAAVCTSVSGKLPDNAPVASCALASCLAVPTGACCLADGVCAQVTESECVDPLNNGLYQGDGTTCSLSACGVCCRGDGVCDDTLDLEVCSSIDGVCVGGVRDSLACAAPWDCPGLCDDGFTQCMTDGDCTATDVCNGVGTCDAVVGLFFPGEDCASLSCPPAGACCVEGQACLDGITTHACDQLGGFWEGAASTCGPPDPCVPGPCCHDNGTCTLATPTQCGEAGGQPPDSGIDCADCPPAVACCRDDGSCTMVTAAACTAAGGTPHPGADCSEPCPPAGGCCLPDDTCSSITEAACLSTPDAVWNGGFLCTSSSDSRCRRGACCRIDGSCDDVVGFLCSAPDDFIALGDCSVQTCIPSGACCIDGDCTLMTEAECNLVGCYEGDAILCDESGLCTTRSAPFSIVDADPPSGLQDARIPHPIDDKAASFLADSIRLTVDAGLANDLCPSAFKIAELGGDETPPEIIDVAIPNPDTVVLTLSEPMEAGTWISISHPNSADVYCLGVLPGDVDMSLITDVADLGALIACLNFPMRCGGVLAGTPCTSDVECAAPDTCVPASCDPLQCDLDRGGVCTGADLSMLINLLNGAGELDSWNGRTLGPSPCP